MFAEAAAPVLKENVGEEQSRQAIHWLRWRLIDRDLEGILAAERYIASFCLSATNPTMWGHYAEAERGFAVVYATTNDGSISISSPMPILSGTRPSKDVGGITEIGLYKEETLKLERVKYATKPPKVNAFPSTDTETELLRGRGAL